MTKIAAELRSDAASRHEVADGMRIDWNVPIVMDDGVTLRADVFRPDDDGRYPVILCAGPYGKGLHFADGFGSAWRRMTTAYPEIVEGTSNKYQVWEAVDPEKWVPDGYVCIRIDSRGAGQSEGFMDVFSEREALDLYQCVEWAGTQPWSSGKVGTSGISYHATAGWFVGALRPPHLAAVCAWEGFVDYYRECARHGGILCDFLENWYPRQVTRVQYGLGERGPRSRISGEPVCGGAMSDDELAANRADIKELIAGHPLIDAAYTGRIPDVRQMTVPVLSAGNWGGNCLHLRGNLDGFTDADSPQKWLEVHGDTHFSLFYANYGLALQKQFFGHFLKGEDNGWAERPRVMLNIRRPGERFALRYENEWPLQRTRWTNFYLGAGDMTLGTDEPEDETQISFSAVDGALQFFSEPVETETEITGPIALTLWVSSSTRDADLFVSFGIFDAAGREVTFIGTNDPRTPIGLGWLRASHRKIDPARSTPARPVHTHDESWPLTPGVPVELTVEIWPTCIVVPPGYRMGLRISGRDYEYDGTDAGIEDAPYAMKGVGPFTHTDPVDRPMDIFGGTTTLHFGAGRAPRLLLPIIPDAEDRT